MNKFNIIAVCAVVITGLFIFTASKPAPDTEQYQYYQFSTIESVVKGGVGRSRLISTTPKGELSEEKMENFFSMVGINFGNIRHNDQMIVDKINGLTDEGWILYNTATGVYADPKGGTGIFISRYLFRKPK